MKRPHNPRRIVRSQQFIRERDELASRIATIPDIMVGVEWVLEHEPERGQQIMDDPPLHAWPTHDHLNNVGLTIYYTIDEDAVTLLSIREVAVL